MPAKAAPLTVRSERIRQHLLTHAEEPGLAALAAKRFKITRQAANKYLRQLTAEGLLIATGSTRGRSYELATIEKHTFHYSITPDLAEDLVWSTGIRPLIANLPGNVLDIWNFGFTEIFNNAIDHSAGKRITVTLARTALNTKIVIRDDGVGIFKKIQKEKNLLDQRHAILELSKGKLTTDSKRHAGWGIFFTSRVVDLFQILSGGIYFSHQKTEDTDWILERDSPDTGGTTVFLTLKNDTKRTKKSVFEKFAVKNQWGFDKTVVPVDLVRYGNDQLVSRSQAKRLLARVDQFAEVVFDFGKVDSVGQAFADEIFRVFASANPKMKLTVLSANRSVQQVISAIQKEARKRV